MNKENIIEYLEENMPDYIFGKLSDEERTKFEKEIANFPDLLQLQNSLGKYSASEAERSIFEGNKDIITNVLQNRKQHKIFTINTYSFSFTVAAVLILAYLLFPNLFNDTQQQNSIKENLKSEISAENVVNFNDNEIADIEDAITEENEIEEFFAAQNKTVSNDDMLEDYTEENYSDLFDFKNDLQNQNSVIPTLNYEKSTYSYIDLLNDIEFEIILEELENVDFKS